MNRIGCRRSRIGCRMCSICCTMSRIGKREAQSVAFRARRIG
jgi:hypothetical protein